MSANSTRDLRNFKGHFRAASMLAFQAAGITVAVLERSVAKLKSTVRIETSFDLGEAMNQETRDSGLRVYDYFPARLRHRIVTGRRQGQSAAADEARDLHESFVSSALDIFAEEKLPFTEAILPYYSVTTLRPLGTKSDFDVIYFEDFTDVDFHVEFGIRATAWPSGT